MPAYAVIREVHVLDNINGRTGCVGCNGSCISYATDVWSYAAYNTSLLELCGGIELASTSTERLSLVGTPIGEDEYHITDANAQSMGIEWD